MTVAGWIVVALLFALVLWLGFAMIALVRTQAGLRARIEDTRGIDRAGPDRGRLAGRSHRAGLGDRHR